VHSWPLWAKFLDAYASEVMTGDSSGFAGTWRWTTCLVLDLGEGSRLLMLSTLPAPERDLEWPY